MHVLITGGSGFVGQALARCLIAARHSVTSLVRSGAAVPEGVSVIRHDLGSGQLTLPNGIEAVVHLAQSRSYRTFPDDTLEMFAVNVAGTFEVLSAAAAAGVRRFLLTSSGTVYEPFAGALVEGTALAPTSFLGASKLAGEVLARPFGTLMDLCVLRLFAPYGPQQEGRLIPDLIRRVRTGEPVLLPLEGEGLSFTPTHVDDVAQVMMCAVVEGWTGTINVASPEVLSLGQVAQAIGRALGRSPVIERRPIATLNIIPDLTALARRVDLSRFRPFEAGLAETLAAGT